MKKLKYKDWGKTERSRIEQLFTGKAEDWNKDSLDAVKKALRESLFVAQNNSCAYCQREIHDEIGQVEIDHIIPKKLAPRFTFEKRNLILTCKRCNHRKGDHNPTTKRNDLMKDIKKYPHGLSVFRWVHPYLHHYDEHIEIKNDCIFMPVGDSKCGRAVIDACKLALLPQVVSRRRAAIVSRSKKAHHAILVLAGAYPDTNEKVLAKEISEKFKEISIEKAATYIKKLRSEEPIDILKESL